MKSAIPSLIDTIEVVDVSVRMIGPKESVIPGANLTARFDLVVSSTGARFGPSIINMEWSEETQNKLRDFLQSIEADICEKVFGLASTDGGGPTDDHNGDGVQEL